MMQDHPLYREIMDARSNDRAIQVHLVGGEVLDGKVYVNDVLDGLLCLKKENQRRFTTIDASRITAVSWRVR